MTLWNRKSNRRSIQASAPASSSTNMWFLELKIGRQRSWARPGEGARRQKSISRPYLDGISKNWSDYHQQTGLHSWWAGKLGCPRSRENSVVKGLELSLFSIHIHLDLNNSVPSSTTCPRSRRKFPFFLPHVSYYQIISQGSSHFISSHVMLSKFS